MPGGGGAAQDIVQTQNIGEDGGYLGRVVQKAKGRLVEDQ